ncbi:acylpyruvase FAHD1, mitochondrial-like [Liolophura sinensis]|uniref:acylpyruvase FAHD1, mitochondrial-like n=1 Tax=Liolophura sinensis TaxID=3198878 RepID=UPI0031591461
MAAQTKLSKFVETGRKIIAVGRNYSEHAAELGNAIPSTPILFLKPPSAYITQGQAIKIPKGCSELHHEVELGIIISKRGVDIPENKAYDYIGGYSLALDMTARDFQSEAKKKGQPWSLAKGFDTSCPVSDFIGADKIPNPQDLRLWLKVNGLTKQDGTTKDMIFNIPYLISYISGFFTLEPGDLILTGTPSGVGPVHSGDVIEAGLEDLIAVKFPVELRS